jgi:hypothetical protein
MPNKLTPDAVRAIAEALNLPLTDDELEPVTDRLHVLLQSLDDIEHLADNTAELDIRFNALWDGYNL